MTADKGKFELIDFRYFMHHAVDRIREDISGVSRAEFLCDNMRGRQMRDAVVLNLGTMGEIAADIRTHYPEFTADNPQFPAARISGMRNQLFHGYHSVNYEIVSTTCHSMVPELAGWLRDSIARCEGIGDRTDQSNGQV